MKSSIAVVMALILASCAHPPGVRPLWTDPPRETLSLRGTGPRPVPNTESYEAFRASVYREPGPGGKFIVDGDTAIAGERKLREFFDAYIVSAPPIDGDPELAVNLVGGRQDVWSNTAKHGLTYCVSQRFGRRHAQVVLAMRDAVAAWEAAGDLRFFHAPDQDARCNASNAHVVFDVNPVNSRGEYLARAFFPHENRATRNVLIDESAFQLEPGELTLTGILRHELGHAIGLRHEHTRPESGQCFEDDEYRPVTAYDAKSTMHYPHCNGLGDWSLALTALDRNGIACLYGPATGFVIDPSICQPRPAVNFTTTKVVKSLKSGEVLPVGRYNAAPGSAIRIDMAPTGSDLGDADLYVKLNAPVGLGSFDCRPMLDGSTETCDLDALSQVTTVDVMVRGIEDGDVSVTIRHLPHITSAGVP